MSGELTIRVESGRLVDLAPLSDGGDTRRIGIGVQMVMLCGRPDADSRIEFLDRFGPSASHAIGERVQACSLATLQRGDFKLLRSCRA